jgi:hypothetical protein
MELRLLLLDDRIVAWESALFYDSREEAEADLRPLEERLKASCAAENGAYITPDGLRIECGLVSDPEGPLYTLTYRAFPVQEESGQ